MTRPKGVADSVARERYGEYVEQRTEAEVVAGVEERQDLLDRIDQGDSGAIGELFEHATGAKVRSVKVTVPRRAAAAPGD